MSKDLSVDGIIKMKHNEFIAYCKSLDLGMKLSLKNIISVSYNQLVTVKESLIALKRTNKIDNSKDDLQCTETLNDTYVAMQLLEDRYNLLTEIIEGAKKS